MRNSKPRTGNADQGDPRRVKRFLSKPASLLANGVLEGISASKEKTGRKEHIW